MKTNKFFLQTINIFYANNIDITNIKSTKQTSLVFTWLMGIQITETHYTYAD